jgi:hypothetical protein
MLRGSSSSHPVHTITGRWQARYRILPDAFVDGVPTRTHHPRREVERPEGNSISRSVIEIVDAPAADGVAGRRVRLDALRRDFESAWHSGHSEVPVVAAVLDTARRWEIGYDTFEAFLDSMALDLTVTSYETWADLQTYIYGSAAVIGLQCCRSWNRATPAGARGHGWARRSAGELHPGRRRGLGPWPDLPAPGGLVSSG